MPDEYITKSKLQQKTIRLFDGIGYFGLLLQWTWAAILYAPLLIESKWLQEYAQSNSASTERTPITLAIPDQFAMLVGGIILAAILVFMFFIVVRTTKTTATVTIKATREAARVVTPIIKKVHHHQRPTSSDKKTALFVTKLLVLIAGYVTALIAASVTDDLPDDVIVIIATAIVGFASLSWIVQCTLAHLWQKPCKAVQ